MRCPITSSTSDVSLHLDAATDENLLHQVAEPEFSSVTFHGSVLGYAGNVAATAVETLAVGVGGSQAIVGRTASSPSPRTGAQRRSTPGAGRDPVGQFGRPRMAQGKGRTQPITSSGTGVSRARNTSPVTVSIAAATIDLAIRSNSTLVDSENIRACRTCQIG